MTITVSVGDFRNNLSRYLDDIARGATVVVKDQKKKLEVAQVKNQHRFDPVAYEAALRAAAGVFTAKNHPEWATRAKVVQWVQTMRKANERHFDFSS